jgi:hypothetical protein
MKAAVPYLTRLARQAAAQPMLWPPRQLFTGGIDMPVLPPDRGGSPRRHAVNPGTSLPGPLAPAAAGSETDAREAIAPEQGVDIGGERMAGPGPGSSASTTSAPVPGATVMPVTSTAPGATATPARSARQEPAPAIPVPRGSPEMHGPPPRVAPHQRSAPYSAPPAAGPADSAAARSAVLPQEPPSASSRPRPEGGTGRAQPPGSWSSPLWGAPVNLPEAIELAPVAGEAARRAISASPAGPATPPGGHAIPPAGPATAGTHQGQRTGDAGSLVAHRASGHHVPDAEDATALYGPREPAPVRDLRPPLPSRTRPAAMSGTETGEPHREPRAPGRPQVSIGTIEVTVLPPAPAVHQALPPPPVARGWSRPPSLLASSAGMDRLRDGLRRWYGTAQG